MIVEADDAGPADQCADVVSIRTVVLRCIERHGVRVPFLPRGLSMSGAVKRT